LRLLLVDDDTGLRSLLRTTFELVDMEVEEAENATAALVAIRSRRPDVVVLDVRMPGMSGLDLCRLLKADPDTASIAVVVLTGSNGATQLDAEETGADAFVRKPFSPLELLGVVERLAGGLHTIPFRMSKARDGEEQLVLYARDLRYLLEIERGQRALLENAYQDTVAALASALESKDTGTRQHSQRVHRYALELAHAVSPDLAEDPSVGYGFLLHDVGKIGIPDRILQKPGPLDEGEARFMKTHTVLGEQMLGGVAFLQGEGIRIVRSHHERWDGHGYPAKMPGPEIPLAARIFAVVDAYDSMTNVQPYREPLPVDVALGEIDAKTGSHFDPDVVSAFLAMQVANQAVGA
jgi:putative two-component system response regulator